MKVELLRLGVANKPSPISDGVMEVRINNQSCKGINLTTRHTQARRAPRVATIHDEVKETIRALLTLETFEFKILKFLYKWKMA
jgi:hypothetical protein